MQARALAEPLLWLALAAGVLWMLVLVELLGADLDNPDGPIAARLPLVAAVLGPGLCLAVGTALALLRRTAWARLAALAAGGLLAAASFGFRRIPEIHRDLAGAYFWVPLVAGVLLGLTALVSWPKPDRTQPVPDATSAAAVVFVSGLAFAGLALLELNGWGWVGVWEEDQPAWDYGLPAVLLGVGMIPCALHAYRQRWPHVATAVVLTGATLAAAVLGAVIAA